MRRRLMLGFVIGFVVTLMAAPGAGGAELGPGSEAVASEGLSYRQANATGGGHLSTWFGDPGVSGSLVLDVPVGVDAVLTGDDMTTLAADLGQRIPMSPSRAIEFPANTPFYVQHGFGGGAVGGDNADLLDPGTRFDLYMYDEASVGGLLAGEELIDEVDGTMMKWNRYVFPDGLTGTRTFEAVWLWLDEVGMQQTVVITFSEVGTFVDDDDSIFEADIEWLAAEGITKGCNPPANDRYCPDSSVTRGQMAAFLVRALGLSDQLFDPFNDDDDSIFEADIEKLAAEGITKGCNPPANDRFCPDAKVTRGQMAAFLVRALGYTSSAGGDLFTDDDDSIFEADIDRLGTAGVTKGCNPPTNDRFCPSGNVTRGQMAAFLRRALG